MRVEIKINLKLDVEHATFNTPLGALHVVERIIEEHLAHHEPHVMLLADTYIKRHTDQAIYISQDMVRPGGIFFMDGSARVGEYCIKSDDPQKHDLYLPAHIFRRCFRWASGDHEQYPNQFSFVEEI